MKTGAIPTLSPLSSTQPTGSVSTHAPKPTIIQIQPGHPNHPPLFLVHPIGGGIDAYPALARNLHPDCPVYGIRAIGLDQESDPIQDMPTMATLYRQAIQRIQPFGPYYLGGWSMGGVVAYEIAQQLQKSVEAVAGLILIDSPAPVPQAHWDIGITTFAQGLGFTPEDLETYLPNLNHYPVEESGQLAQLMAQGLALQRFPESIEMQQLQALYTVFKAHRQALMTYRATPSHALLPTLLFDAQEPGAKRLPLLRSKAVKQWHTLLPNSITVHPLKGNHFTLLQEPQVVTLASQVNDFLLPLAKPLAVLP